MRAKRGISKKKGVKVSDVYEVQSNRPKFFLRSPEWGIYNMIAESRRALVSIMHLHDDSWRLITAYWNADGRAQRIYEASQ